MSKYQQTASVSARPENSEELRRWATLGALTLAASAENWTTTGVSLILPDLSGSLSSSTDETSWALTVYTTAFAIAIALSNQLSLRLGNRRLLGSAAVLYTVAAVGCALSPTLGVFLVMRLLAGLSGGIFLVRAFVFFSQSYPAQDRGKPSIIFAITYFLIGRVIAPLVSGWLTDVESWRLLFVPVILLISAAGFLFFRFAKEHWTEEEQHRPIDVVGVLLLTASAAFLQIVFSRGETDGWLESPLLASLLLCGFTANVAFLAWQLAPINRWPLLQLDRLRDRAEAAAAVLGFCLGILLAGSLYVIPLFLRGIESHSALQTGELLSIVGLGALTVLCSFSFVSNVIQKFGSAPVLTLALVAEIISQLLFARVITPDTPDRYLWLPLALNGVFIALSVPTLGIVAFVKVSAAAASSARATYYGFRQLGASVGVTLASVLIDRRMSFHSSRLLDSFAARDVTVLGTAANVSSRTLSMLVRRQSSTLSYSDVFITMTLVAVCTLAFIPLLPQPSAPGSDADERTPPPAEDSRLSAGASGASI
jgi:EmrB/QacA subfamily drug resistance transporter